MKVERFEAEGLLLIEPKVFNDGRGFFLETFQAERYAEQGIRCDFVQDNHSRSARGTLRGLHFQLEKPQGKLVRVSSGEIVDVVVDCRPRSKTFGETYAVVLSANNFRQFWVPAGFAHGFVVTSEDAEFLYKCSDYYHPQSEGTLLWNDSKVEFDWPIDKPVLSEKDAAGKSFEELVPLFEQYYSEL